MKKTKQYCEQMCDQKYASCFNPFYLTNLLLKLGLADVGTSGVDDVHDLNK